MRDVLVKCPRCRQTMIFKTSTGLFVSSRAVEATSTKATITRVKCRTCRTWVEFGQGSSGVMAAF